MKEIWKDVVGYEGHYKVSNIGRVKSIDRVIRFDRRGKVVLVKKYGKIIIQHKNKKGYMLVGLYINGTHVTRRAHRVVAIAFIPNPENKICINHINEISNDNRVENLEWCTYLENNNHGTVKQRISDTLIREKNRSIIVEQLSLDGEFIKEWPSMKDTGRSGYTPCLVKDCCNDYQNTHAGYKWRYKESKPQPPITQNQSEGE